MKLFVKLFTSSGISIHFTPNFVLIVDFEQVNVCLAHIEKENIFEDKIGHIMHYILF